MSKLPYILAGLGVAIAIAETSRRLRESAPTPTPMKTPTDVKNQGAPFADPTGMVWPVTSSSPSRLLVPFVSPDGTVHTNLGQPSGNRFFKAMRQDNLRYHAAIDLVSSPGDPILATEPGKVVGFASGFGIGAGLDAVVIEHPSIVIVYAEIVRESGLAIGSLVTAGQRIGRGGKNGSGNSMLHFETWAKGHAPSSFTPWWVAGVIPTGLHDPTKYLLALAIAKVV